MLHGAVDGTLANAVRVAPAFGLAKIKSQHQRIDEQSGDWFKQQILAAGHLRAHDHVWPPRLGCQRHCQCRCGDGVHRLPLPARNCFKRIHQCGGNIAQPEITRRSECERTRLVWRHFKPRQISKRAAPVIGIGIEGGAGQHICLPQRVVGELHFEFRQCRRRARHRLGDQRAELAAQHTHRPAIGGNVVHRQQDHDAALIEPQHGQPDRRTGDQIKRPLRLAQADSLDILRALLGLEAAHIDQRDLALIGRHDHLPWLAIAINKPRAQNFVTINQQLERTRHRRIGHGALHLPAYGHVERWIAGRKLLKKPEPLLRQRARQLSARISVRL